MRFRLQAPMLIGASTLLVACSGSDDGSSTGAGGDVATAGGAVNGVGGLSGIGGSNSATGVGGGNNPVANGGTSVGVGGDATRGGASAGGASNALGGAATGGQSGAVTSGGTAAGGKSVGGNATVTAGGNATGGKSTGGAATANGGKSSGGSATGGISTGGSGKGGAVTGGTSTGGTSTGGTSTGGTSTGGAATGGAGTCTASWNPPATANGNTNLPAGLDQVWAHSGATIMAANNVKIYQIMANKGTMNYCVRWDSTTTINGTVRDQIEALIAKNEKQWIDKLKDWGCWPYPEVTVKVSLWAVKNRALLNWSDSETTAKVVVNSDASCPSDCGPWSPTNAHANCSSAKYDEFFWLDGSVTTFTGWGSATGFMMGASSFLNAATSNANGYVILAHEMGHAFGLDDFYDWQPTGWTSWIMNAGSSQSVTDTDGWMLRDVWRHVRSKYGYPGP